MRTMLALAALALTMLAPPGAGATGENASPSRRSLKFGGSRVPSGPPHRREYYGYGYADYGENGGYGAYYDYDYEYEQGQGGIPGWPGKPQEPDHCDLLQDGSIILPGKKTCDLEVIGDPSISRIPGGLSGRYFLYTCKQGMPAYMRHAESSPSGHVVAATIQYSAAYREWEFEVPGTRYLLNDTTLPLLPGEEDTVVFSSSDNGNGGNNGGNEHYEHMLPYEIDQWHVVTALTDQFVGPRESSFDIKADMLCAEKKEVLPGAPPRPSPPAPDQWTPTPAPNKAPRTPAPAPYVTANIRDEVVVKAGGGAKMLVEGGMSQWAQVFVEVFHSQIYTPIDVSRALHLHAALVLVPATTFPSLAKAAAAPDREAACPIDRVERMEFGQVLLSYKELEYHGGQISKFVRVASEDDYVVALVSCASLQEVSMAVRVGWCNYTTDATNMDDCTERLRAKPHTYGPGEPFVFDPNNPASWFSGPPPPAGDADGGGVRREGHGLTRGWNHVMGTVFITLLVVAVLAAAAVGGVHVAKNGLPEGVQKFVPWGRSEGGAGGDNGGFSLLSDDP